MARQLSFTRVEGYAIGNTETYALTEKEMQQVFEGVQVRGADVEKKIKDHEDITVSPPEDDRIEINFWKSEEVKDRWLVEATLPPDAALYMPEKLADMLEAKEPIDA